MTIDLYYSVSSPPCRSVVLLAKTLGLELNLKNISTRDNEHKTPEFLKLNPQHSIPTLVDNGFSIWESRAILAYLVNKYAKDDSLYPKDAQKRAVVDQRLHFDLGTLFPRLREYVVDYVHSDSIFSDQERLIVRGKDEQIEDKIALRTGNKPSEETVTKLEEAFQFLEKFLEGQESVAGNNITIADYALVISVSVVDLFNYDIGKYKNITKWISRIKKTITGYDEVQEAGNAVLKEMFKTPPPK